MTSDGASAWLPGGDADVRTTSVRVCSYISFIVNEFWSIVGVLCFNSALKITALPGEPGAPPTAPDKVAPWPPTRWRDGPPSGSASDHDKHFSYWINDHARFL